MEEIIQSLTDLNSALKKLRIAISFPHNCHRATRLRDFTTPGKLGAQSSRVSLGSEPRLSPLTEPYVRVSYTAPVSDSSDNLRQDSGFHIRQIEQALVGQPAVGHGVTRLRTL